MCSDDPTQCLHDQSWLAVGTDAIRVGGGNLDDQCACIKGLGVRPVVSGSTYNCEPDPGLCKYVISGDVFFPLFDSGSAVSGLDRVCACATGYENGGLNNDEVFVCEDDATCSYGSGWHDTPDIPELRREDDDTCGCFRGYKLDENEEVNPTCIRDDTLCSVNGTGWWTISEGARLADEIHCGCEPEFENLSSDDDAETVTCAPITTRCRLESTFQNISSTGHASRDSGGDCTCAQGYRNPDLVNGEVVCEDDPNTCKHNQAFVLFDSGSSQRGENAVCECKPNEGLLGGEYSDNQFYCPKNTAICFHNNTWIKTSDSSSRAGNDACQCAVDDGYASDSGGVQGDGDDKEYVCQPDLDRCRNGEAFVSFDGDSSRRNAGTWNCECIPNSGFETDGDVDGVTFSCPNDVNQCNDGENWVDVTDSSKRSSDDGSCECRFDEGYESTGGTIDEEFVCEKDGGRCFSGSEWVFVSDSSKRSSVDGSCKCKPGQGLESSGSLNDNTYVCTANATLCSYYSDVVSWVTYDSDTSSPSGRNCSCKYGYHNEQVTNSEFRCVPNGAKCRPTEDTWVTIDEQPHLTREADGEGCTCADGYKIDPDGDGDSCIGDTSRCLRNGWVTIDEQPHLVRAEDGEICTCEDGYIIDPDSEDASCIRDPAKCYNGASWSLLTGSTDIGGEDGCVCKTGYHNLTTGDEAVCAHDPGWCNLGGNWTKTVSGVTSRVYNSENCQCDDGFSGNIFADEDDKAYCQHDTAKCFIEDEWVLIKSGGHAIRPTGEYGSTGCGCQDGFKTPQVDNGTVICVADEGWCKFNGTYRPLASAKAERSETDGTCQCKESFHGGSLHNVDGVQTFKCFRNEDLCFHGEALLTVGNNAVRNTDNDCECATGWDNVAVSDNTYSCGDCADGYEEDGIPVCGDCGYGNYCSELGLVEGEPQPAPKCPPGTNTTTVQAAELGECSVCVADRDFEMFSEAGDGTPADCGCPAGKYRKQVFCAEDDDECYEYTCVDCNTGTTSDGGAESILGCNKCKAGYKPKNKQRYCQLPPP